MGTWGMRSFENDSALDWVADLAESDGLELLDSSLETTPDDGYLDSDIAVAAIAAAEVVAALLGKPAAKLPEAVEKWVADRGEVAAKYLVPKAIAAVDDTLGKDSELRELWEENEEDFPVWKAGVQDLRARLAGITS